MGGNDKIKVIASDITPHLFRHTYATSLHAAGVSLKNAQYLLGHSDASTTLNIYTHLEEKSQKNDVEKIENFFKALSVKK